MLNYSCIVICIFSYTRLDGRAKFCMNLIPCINKAYVCMYVCMYVKKNWVRSKAFVDYCYVIRHLIQDGALQLTKKATLNCCCHILPK